MDRNFLLFVVLSMLIVTLYTSRQPPVEPVPAEPGPTASQPGPSETASPVVATERIAPQTDAEREQAAGRAAEQLEPFLTHEIEGNLVRAQFSSAGGVMVRHEMLEYESWDPPGNDPMDLLMTTGAPMQVGATPFEGLGLGDLRHARFSVESADSEGVTYVLERGGMTIRKVWELDPETYGFTLKISLENMSGEMKQSRFAVEWPVTQIEGNDYAQASLVTRHDGEVSRTLVQGVGSSGFFGIGGDDGLPNTAGVGGVEWFGADTKYFVGVLAPQRTASASTRYVKRSSDGTVAANVFSYDAIMLPSGNRITQEFDGYLGPKIDAQLGEFGANLVSSIDRGWSWVEPLTTFFAWLLRVLYGFIPNYGFCIIVITLLVRVVTLPIIQKQMKSMEKMRLLQPRMKEIQEQYGDNREKQSEAMMAMYKETGVNPLGGCLPMLLQLPVFIGLFYALQSSIELRHAPFILWMTDLSAPETLFMIPGLEIPFRLLPILMAGSMVLQAKFQPTGPDPAQQRMMMTMMPIMMLVLFYSFPSGLVLYYMLSNFLGIAHQRWVGRNMS
ncbi:MAG: membrane protein insertase YidC [Myxococcota bacterium]|nr:membrane protein insertase YidC [Myxococcota bacterium]